MVAPLDVPDAPDAGPRPHHYHLVHTVLRHVAQSDPLACLGALGVDAPGFLGRVWEMVLECCADQPPPDFGPADITVDHARVGDFPCAVLTLPTPRAITEAHLAGLVIPVPLATLEDSDAAAPLRFFTLEFGSTLDGAPRTVLCEWTGDAHVNYGDGPPPTVGDFLASLAQHLSGAPE